jgi:hypothetical protein
VPDLCISVAIDLKLNAREALFGQTDVIGSAADHVTNTEDHKDWVEILSYDHHAEVGGPAFLETARTHIIFLLPATCDGPDENRAGWVRPKWCNRRQDA